MSLFRLLLSGAVLTLLTFGACQKKAETAPASTGITGRILISPQEYVGTNGRQLSLSCRDEGQYSCSNFPLLTQFTHQGQSLRLSFSGVDKNAALCLTSIGPATSIVDVTSLDPGIYPIDLQVGTRQTTGTLELTSAYLRVQSNDPNVVAVSFPEIRFTPTTAIWGHVIFSRPADQSAALALSDSLQRMGAVSLTLPIGQYGRFAIDATGKLTPPTVLPGVTALPLLFTYTADFKRVKAVISRAKAVTPTLNMYLTSYQGDAISN
jgi:hypothetical protein